MKKSELIVCVLTVALAVATGRSIAWGATAPANAPATAPAKNQTGSSAPAGVAAKAPAGPAKASAAAKAPSAGSVKAPASVPAKVAAVPANAPHGGSAKASAGVPSKTPATPAKVTASTQAKTETGSATRSPVSTASLESYSYSPVGKPDPFVPFIEKEMLLQKRAMKKTSSSIFPLQNANIEQFKLVGIAGNERRRTAVVEDERGKFYTLSEGTLIGRNHGKVKSILADRVIVEEKRDTDAGAARINRITMKLHKEDNEGKP